MSSPDSKIVAFIPAHMASVRFPGKVLHEIQGLPMIEHVRRRALMSNAFEDVIVATCDHNIAAVIEGFGGTVIRTSDKHKNGTSRIAEAAGSVDCSHIVLLQADEPLLIPADLRHFVNHMLSSDPATVAWNATGPIERPEELDRHSFVKCFVNHRDRILFCFRRSPCYGPFETTVTMVRKILGIIGYKKEFLLEFAGQEAAPYETAEFIEQMRIIEYEARLESVPLDHTLPSINEPQETEEVVEWLNSNENQRALLDQVLGFQKTQ